MRTNLVKLGAPVLVLALFVPLTLGCASVEPIEPIDPASIPENSPEDFRTAVTEDGTGVVITKYIGKSRNVRVPAVIQGLPVKVIGEEAFKEEWDYKRVSWGAGILNVVLPDEIEEISTGAFANCRGLQSIVMPSGLRRVGSGGYYKGIFSGCSSLKSVTIPGGLTKIGEYMFRGCTSLASISIPGNVTEIGKSAFSGCSSLTSISIPNSVTKIGQEAFSRCENLTSVTLPAGIREIEEAAFEQCPALAEIIIPASVQAIKFKDDNFMKAFFSYYREGSLNNKLDLATQAALRKLALAAGSAPSSAAQPSVITITAQELMAAYRSNQVRADTQYKNKTVKVTGKVQGIEQDLYDRYYVKLEGQAIFYTVNVYIKSSEISKAANLDEGQTVTFTGTCDGFSITSVDIKNAVFSK